MLSMPINCRRNLNCVRGEKVAFHGPILLYQFAIIKQLLRSCYWRVKWTSNINLLYHFQVYLPPVSHGSLYRDVHVYCVSHSLYIFTPVLFESRAVKITDNLCTLEYLIIAHCVYLFPRKLLPVCLIILGKYPAMCAY